MDCYNWRNCEGDCENCEVANMDIAQAVQHWPDADFMTYTYSPEEILGLLRQLGERAERAEKERDRYATILDLASRFAAASPETQIKDDGSGVIDGRWLAAHIQDVLEGEA